MVNSRVSLGKNELAGGVIPVRHVPRDCFPGSRLARLLEPINCCAEQRGIHHDNVNRHVPQ